MIIGLKISRKLVALAASFASFCVLADAEQKYDTSRVVALGGPVTEIVYALGQQDKLIGADLSSVYPPEASELPSVGYYRRLPPEGVASLRPSLVLASEHAGPHKVIDQLNMMNIPTVLVSDQPSIESLHERVTQIAKILGVEAKGEELLANFTSEMERVSHQPEKRIKGMTVVMRGGTLLAAGGMTAADLVLEVAGVDNVLRDIQSYKPLSAEIASALAPEVIVVTTSTIESMGGLDAVKKSPALSMTPAVANNKIVILDDLLAQTFGLRLPQAIETVRDGAFGGNQ